MRKLLKGIVEFRRNLRADVRERFARLALGQSPDTLFIACSDSRVVPNLFASTDPGDLFVIRNVGNLVTRCAESEGEAAALDFSIQVLRVSDIVVCGHSECGAMRALLDGVDPRQQHLRTWLRHAEGALERIRKGERMKADLPLHNHLSQLNVLEQVEHLKTYPVVRERVADGRLRLHAWWFDIAEAEVQVHAEDRARFVVVDESEAARLLAALG